MALFIKKFLSVVIFSVALLLASCGGGSGSDGGSDGSGLHRGSSTAVRLIHSAVDTEPLDLRIADKYYGRAYFMQEVFFQETPAGAVNILLERANSPGVVLASRTATLQKDTEYSLLVTGRSANGTLDTTLLEEPPVRPAVGNGRVQFINALSGTNELSLEGTGISMKGVAFRRSSGFTELPAGNYTAEVNRSGGGSLGHVEFVLSGGDEVTVVIGGDNSMGIRFIKTLRDLD